MAINETGKVETRSLESKSRRKVVKQIAGGVTALAAYHVLPVKWEKPIIEQVFLPAHAQTSGVVEGEIVEHSHPHTHDEDHPETHVDSHSHSDPHPDTDAHKHAHDVTDPKQKQHVLDQSSPSPLVTISSPRLQAVPSDNEWHYDYIRSITNGPVELSHTLENIDISLVLGTGGPDSVPDGTVRTRYLRIPFVLLSPGQTLRLTVTSPDPNVVITGSPLDIVAPVP